MVLRRPCEHGFYDEHRVESFAPVEEWQFCPGGEFLADDGLVIERGRWSEWAPPEPGNGSAVPPSRIRHILITFDWNGKAWIPRVDWESVTADL